MLASGGGEGKLVFVSSFLLQRNNSRTYCLRQPAAFSTEGGILIGPFAKVTKNKQKTLELSYKW